ncbi:hypothetical protein B0T10DRAFT_48810 [Thelonectria olida]|uniref:Uncharacterized protein n=1 Tax=Thelonectria olida TaxID=1576542 RepID=A0A9P9ALP5_9HYPO|nr:hypothetical protein B0T10DRAFT_48810 [Thelonectria olida]
MAPRESSIGRVVRLIALSSTLTLVHGQQEQVPLSDDHDDQRPLYPSRDALLTTYLDPKYPCVRERGQDVAELDLPVNVCASANFTLDNNVHLEYPGLCEGGVRTPYIAIYPSADCTGDHAHPDWYDRRFSAMGPGHCLSKAVWGTKDLELVEHQWSMMLRCDEDTSEVSTTTDTVKLSLPQPPPPPPEKPKAPRPTTASVSDSACYIPSLGMKGHPRFIFQRPEADTCVNVAPEYKLKIYRTALCPNGTDALFAKFTGKGCLGPMTELKEVDESMIATNGPETCIEMGGKEASSYAFWCTGNLQSKKVEQGLFPDEEEGQIHVHYSYGNPPRGTAVRSGASTNQVVGFYGAGVVLFGLLGGLW